jgi:hypothetical protein
VLITPEYQQQQREFHEARPDYGVSSSRHVDFILHLAEQMKTRDILDYGCGKACLQKGIPFPIQNYDPAMPEYNRTPEPADIVVCTDVLEHIELDCLDTVLDDLARLTKQVIFLNVACRPAKKFLPDGRNAHLIQQPPNWWIPKLNSRWLMTTYQIGKGEFTAMLVPIPETPSEQS